MELTIKHSYAARSLTVKRIKPVETIMLSKRGMQGAKGATGDGEPGKSTYQLWLDNGNSGSLEDYQLTLKGGKGDAGQGVPTGGAAGQLLAKATASDYDSQWVDPPSGGSSFDQDLNTTDTVGFKNVSIRDGITPTGLTLTNTYTDASNYERGFIKWDANKLKIGTEAAGTGVVRDVQISNELSVVGDINAQGIYIDRTNEGGGINTPFAKFGLNHWHGNSNSITLQKAGNSNYFSFATQAGDLKVGDYATGQHIILTSAGAITTNLSTSFRVIQHNAANNNSGNYLELTNGTSSSGVRGKVLVNGDLIINDYFTESPVEKVRLGNNGDVTIKGVINQRTESAADPTTTEYPNDKDTGTHLNTTTGKLYTAHNYGGTIYKTELI